MTVLAGWPGVVDDEVAGRDGWAARRRAVEEHVVEAIGDLRQMGACLDPDVDVLDGRGRRLGPDGASPNGRCRIVATTDGHAAVQLARPADVDAVAPLVGAVAVDDPWRAIDELARASTARSLVDRCRLLEIPSAVLGEIPEGHGVVVHRIGPPAHRPGPVLDLSSMWAGPLCARLLGEALDRPVVDVESLDRPDPMRTGPDRLSGWLHEGRRLQRFDHTSVAGLAELGRLVDQASVVVTSGRSRMFGALGLDPARWARELGGTWVHVSGHGLTSALRDAVAFGDDAAVAGGLVAVGEHGPTFLGDALADPLAGVAGARAAIRVVASGGGGLVDVALSGVAADVSALVDRRLGS